MGALRVPAFRRWFLSQILSASGSSTQAVGLAWLVVVLGGGGLGLGIIIGLLAVPTLVFGPLLGTWADRVDRQRLLLATNGAQLLICVAMGVITAAGWATLPLTGVFAFALGIASAVDGPARQVFVLELVGRENLSSAVALNEVALNASRVLGPALGGLILTFGSPWICFIANGLTFAAPVVVLALLKKPENYARPVRPAGGHPSGDTRAGVRYAFSNPRIRAGLIFAMMAGPVFNIAVVMPLMATQVFRVGGGAFGTMMACFGVGALPGALIASRSSGAPKGREVLLAALATGASVVLTSTAPTLYLMDAGLGLVGLTSIWFISRTNALVLIETRSDYRGRVMGIWTAALPGSGIITGSLIGTAASLWGPRIAYALVGAGMLTAAGIAGPALRGRGPVPETVLDRDTTSGPTAESGHLTGPAPTPATD